MKMIEIEYQDAVAVVKLNRSVTNAIDLELVRELAEAIDAVAADDRACAVVLCSGSEKFFSIGFDIPHLLETSGKDFQGFYESFNRVCLALYTLPIPMIPGRGWKRRRKSPRPAFALASSAPHQAAPPGARTKRRCQLTILKIVLAIFFPPVAAAMQVGISTHFWINVILTLLGMLPGVIHALWLVITKKSR